MAEKTVKRSIAMSPEMHNLLVQIAAKRRGDVTESDLIREAIREYLDQQADIIGSRRHFQKSLQTRVEALENSLTFHLHLVIALLSMLLDDPHQAVDEAIIAARRDGQQLLSRIEAVRSLKS